MHGGEEAEFSDESSKPDGTLLFGRVTYQQMASFWPTEQAKQMFAKTAENMTRSPKIVFSRTLTDPGWENVTVVREDAVAAVRRLKETSDRDMTVLGSGSIVTQLADAGLIDAYQIMLDPVALGAGRTVFAGISRKLNLRLTSTRTFKSGVLLLNYENAT